MAVEDITTKLCNKCGETKPLAGFSKDRSKRDGLSTICKCCRSAGHAEWRAKNPDQVKANYAAWYAANADKARSYSKEYRLAHPEQTKAAVDAWRKENPDKSKAAMARWSVANKDRKKELNHSWYLNNKTKVRVQRKNRKLRMKSGRLSVDIVEKLLKIQKGKCACCKKPLGEDFHLDHIMPLALGGTNTNDNVQLLRKLCNLQKNAKHPVDFMQQRGFLI